VSDQATLRALVAELREHERPETLVERALVPAMTRLGAEWAQGLLPPEVVASAARTAEYVADLLAPPPAPPRPGAARVAIGSLDSGHSLGRRLVRAHHVAAGLEVTDLGADLTPDAALEGVVASGAQVLLLSASMVRCALRVAELAARLRAAPSRVPIGVGGAPFRLEDALWREVGADGSAAAAHEAPGLVARLLGTVP
jgi:methanogenic corrinoid protein MtbC1